MLEKSVRSSVQAPSESKYIINSASNQQEIRERNLREKRGEPSPIRGEAVQSAGNSDEMRFPKETVPSGGDIGCRIRTGAGHQQTALDDQWNLENMNPQQDEATGGESHTNMTVPEEEKTNSRMGRHGEEEGNEGQ